MGNFSKDLKNNIKAIKIPRFNVANGFLATEKSSNLMRKIKSSNELEVLARKTLWHLGYRYKVNYAKLPGKPDIVFTGKKVVIFIDGDFWHGYNWAQRKKKLKSNKEYWIPKIERNIQRDIENNLKLQILGYKVLRFWEHDIKKDFNQCIERIIANL